MNFNQIDELKIGPGSCDRRCAVRLILRVTYAVSLNHRTWCYKFCDDCLKFETFEKAKYSTGLLKSTDLIFLQNEQQKSTNELYRRKKMK